MTARTEPGASSDGLARCFTMARVNAREGLAYLGSSADTQLETGPLSCELAAGHDDSHIAMVATVHGGDQGWRLQWHGQPADTVEVVQIDP